MSRRFSFDNVLLRAFDLSERSAAFGRRTVKQRAHKLRERLFFLLQCTVTAGLAWWVATAVLHHTNPFFAPVAAMIVLGSGFGHRVRRALEVGVGVAVGVFVGDVFVHFFGMGVIQIVIVAFLAMCIATVINPSPLIVTQAGVQAIIVTTLVPDAGQAFGRWLDAVVGCALAIVVTTVAPSAPLAKPRIMAARVLAEVSATLKEISTALRTQDGKAAEEVLERARASETHLEALSEATKEGLAVARQSIFRRGAVSQVQAYADLSEPLDRLTRNLRVLARRAAIATWRHEPVPKAYLELLDQLGGEIEYMAGELWNRRLPTSAKDRLIAVGESTSHVAVANSISAVVILAQARSMIADLLLLTGMKPEDVRDAIPEMD